MTEHDDDAYWRFLDGQSLPTLRDWALQVARERLDVGFLWDLAHHLPDNYEATRDLAALDPFDAAGELTHLLTHFREEAVAPEVAPMLRARYIDYLAEHADTHRFDRSDQEPAEGARPDDTSRSG